MRVIIWGAEGQDGYYLSLLLHSLGIDIKPIGRTKEIMHPDITAFEEVASVISTYKPDYIFNFAADSTTRHESWLSNHRTISGGTLNILESVRLHSPETKIFLAGSGLQFRNTGLPIHESDPFEATSMYAVSRIQTTFAARYYRNKFGLKIYNGFLFNHDSPKRTPRHVNMKIMEIAYRIAQGENEMLEIGDISVRKEFGYAGDIVQAIWQFVNQDNYFEAVIGTGIFYSIEEWIKICFSLYGLDWQAHTKIIPNFKPEYKVLVSNPTTIKSLGWQPKVSISDLANIMRL